MGLGGVATATLVVGIDHLIATVEDAHVDVVVDGEEQVIAFPLHASVIVVGNEMELQARVGLAHIKVGVLQSVDGLRAGRCHSRPSTEGLGVAPGIEGQVGLARLIEYEQRVSVVLHRGLEPYFLHAVGSNPKEDVTVDGEVEVGQLHTIAAIVEDEVLHQSGVPGTHVEVLPCHALMFPCACHGHSGPVAIQVVDIAPHIEREDVPSRLVVDIDTESVVLGLRSLATSPVVGFPALSPHVGERAQARILGMVGSHTVDGEFHTLSG